MFFANIILMAAVAAGSPTNMAAVAVDSMAKKPSAKSARITSATTYYDRKEGVAIFTGKVHVEDEHYQLHADKAYVFMNGTNELERIVAIGNVAMTNENKRAYGAKASYYRSRSMVVLHSGEGHPAEVREVHPDGDRIVRGGKIRFWTDSEQVEVIDADITAPANIDARGFKSFGRCRDSK